MKILIAAPRFPYPLDKGDRLTVYNYLKYFNAVGFNVTLVVFYENESELNDLDKIQGFCEKIITVKLTKLIALINIIKNVFKFIPLQISYHKNSKVQKIIDKLVQAENYDLLYAHTIRMAPYLIKHKLPKVCAMQISMALNYRRLKENSKNVFQKIFYGLEWKLVNKYEYNLTFHFDRCFLISQYDKNEIESNRKELKNIFFNPHGVDHKFFKPDLSVIKEKHSIIMTGNFGYFPNADAIVYFYKSIFPIIKNKIPDVKVYVVGKNPPAELKNINSKNIIVTGMVEDLRPYLNKSSISIDPLRIGAGLQNKVIEAMSMQLPVVATSIANEGIKAVDNRDILIADNENDFAKKVIDLFEDKEKRELLAENARKFILTQYTWEYFLNQLVEQFRLVINSYNEK